MNDIKQSTAYSLTMLLVGATDHNTGITAGTIASYLSKAGGTFASFAPTITEIGYGNYKVALGTGNTDTLGDLLLHFTEPRADAVDIKYQVAQYLPTDVYNSGTNTQGTLQIIYQWTGGTVASASGLASLQGTANLLSKETSIASIQGTVNLNSTAIASVQGTANLLSTQASNNSIQGTVNSIAINQGTLALIRTDIASLQGTTNTIYQNVSGTSAKETSLQSIYGTLNTINSGITNIQGTVNGIQLTIGTIYGQTGTIYAVEVGQWTLTDTTLTYKFNGTNFKTFTLGTYNGAFGVFNSRT